MKKKKLIIKTLIITTLIITALITSCFTLYSCANNSAPNIVVENNINDGNTSSGSEKASSESDNSDYLDNPDNSDNLNNLSVPGNINNPDSQGNPGKQTNQSDSGNPATSNNSDEIDVSVKSGSYTFLDVFRNSHDMDLREGAYANVYHNKNYSYIPTDSTGKVLTDGSELTGFSENDHDTQSVGYKGIIKYEDDIYTSKFGIDVSKFQGKIDWNKVKNAGVEFAIVRIGYRGYGSSGSLEKDKYYRQNIEGATAAGLDVGVYFYAQAINEDEAIEEAEFVLSLLDDLSINLPIVYDPEHVLNDTARTDNVTGEQFTKNARAFCDTISANGFTPMIYANMMWEAYELDMKTLSDIPVWYADYEALPQSPYYFSMWQYSQGGKISGIDGTVDLDIMYIKKSEL